MKGMVVAAVVSAFLAAGAVLVTGLQGASPFGDDDPDIEDEIPFECEDLTEADAIVVKNETEEGGVEREFEIKAEADTRVRVEAEAEEESDAGESEREARVEVCGFVEFVDEDGDGALSGADTVVDTTPVAFGPIAHAMDVGDHVFTATSVDGDLTVEVRVAGTPPAAGALFLRWSLRANPVCATGATHYAVLVEQEGATDMESFLVAACGAPLEASGEA